MDNIASSRIDSSTGTMDVTEIPALSELGSTIAAYYDRRGLKTPTALWAVIFAQTELAEALEVLLEREGGWVRNHPDDKPAGTSEELGEELGDAIMMLMVAGLVDGVDPLACLRAKITRKLREDHDA